MCSTVETDASCINTSDSISSSILNSSYGDVAQPININEGKDSISQMMDNVDPVDVNSITSNSVSLLSSSKHVSSSDSCSSGDGQTSNTSSKTLSNNQLYNNCEELLLDSSNQGQMTTSSSSEFDSNNLVKNLLLSNYEQLNNQNDSRNSVESNQSKPTEYLELCSTTTQETSTTLVQSTSDRTQEDVMIPSESAADEPQEMAYVPENMSCGGDSTATTDTASILQELALQRLSGEAADPPTSPVRQRSNVDKDLKSFDSEIEREIVRQNKMRTELENARENNADSPTSPTHK